MVKPLGTVSHALETVWNPHWDTNRVSPCNYEIKPYNEREVVGPLSLWNCAMKLCIEGDINFIPKFHILETGTVKLSIETGLSRELYKLYKILDGKNSTQLIIHSLNPIGRKFDRLYNGKDSTQLITHSPLITHNGEIVFLLFFFLIFSPHTYLWTLLGYDIF
jgi:hypothetical protein